VLLTTLLLFIASLSVKWHTYLMRARSAMPASTYSATNVAQGIHLLQVPVWDLPYPGSQTAHRLPV
jgi:hypothetical protein